MKANTKSFLELHKRTQPEAVPLCHLLQLLLKQESLQPGVSQSDLRLIKSHLDIVHFLWHKRAPRRELELAMNDEYDMA